MAGQIKTASAIEIANAFSSEGVRVQPIMADEGCTIPSYRWVWTTFAADWRRWLEMVGPLGYKPSSNDCDDFARQCAVVAQICHARTLKPKHAVETALAFGEFWYMATNGAHAINVFVYSDDDAVLRLGFFEPQSSSIVKLTTAHVRSCYFARL